MLGMTRLGPKPILVGAALMTIVMVVGLQREKNLSESEKELALEECLAENPDSVCAEMIEANHEMCFSYNYKASTKYSGPRFNREQYRQCLCEGAQEWFGARLSEQARARKYAQDLLE